MYGWKLGNKALLPRDSVSVSFIVKRLPSESFRGYDGAWQGYPLVKKSIEM